MTTTGRRIAWFNTQAGVAGDMTMAALVDAGADPDMVADAVAALGVGGYALMFERVQRCGVGATWANVVVHQEPHAPHADHDSDDQLGAREPHTDHRPVGEILELLDNAELHDRIRDLAVAVFRRLAEVEGTIHGIEPHDVGLHEVGAVDSIVDVVGACAALVSLDVDEVVCSPVALGTGSIRSAHGVLPNPAPATMALLADAGAPTVGLDTTLETTTPTGAALMTTWARSFGAMPPLVVDAVGYGAGTADLADRANVVQVVIGRAAGPLGDDADHDDARTDARTDAGTPVMLLEANVDDATGEVLAHAVSKLLAAGAHDAWLVPIVMKKGRPAHTVSVLADPSRAAELREVLVRETGTLGVRARELRRWPQRRSMTTVDVDGHPVGVKIGGDRVKVEFDDAARAASALDRPVRTVIERATALARADAGS